MRTITFALALGCVVSVAVGARADSFTFEHSAGVAVDPAADCESDCLGAEEADDCAARAALLSAELVEVLTELEDESDSETVALFQSATDMADPRVQEVALRYFAHHGEPPSDLWSRVRDFFFGPEPSLGQAAAEILERSSDEQEREQAKQYLKGRPRNGYAGDFPAGTGSTDSWALAAGNDAVLERLDAFEPDERFADAERLLLLDRFLADPLSGDFTAQVPMAGFVTDAPRSEVEQHFTKVFGAKPYPSLEAAQKKYTALLQELQEVQARLLGGDTSVASRLGQLANEVQAAQLAVSAGQRLDLEAMQCTDHVYWLSGNAEDLFSEALPRALALGPDALSQRTAIRYFNGERRGPSEGPRPDTDEPEPGNDVDGGSTDGDSPRAKADGGCSLVASDRGGVSGAWLVLLALGLARARQRRRRDRHS
ncbi:MAG TPA: hypothetical protein VFZ61_23325 [Polyangiales bacterium]